jgi:hypothetical protein
LDGGRKACILLQNILIVAYVIAPAAAVPPADVLGASAEFFFPLSWRVSLLQECYSMYNKLSDVPEKSFLILYAE